MKHLENNQTAWLEFLAGQQELDAFLVTDRERLHKLLCQQEYGVRVTKKDVLKELEVRLLDTGHLIFLQVGEFI